MFIELYILYTYAYSFFFYVHIIPRVVMARDAHQNRAADDRKRNVIFLYKFVYRVVGETPPRCIMLCILCLRDMHRKHVCGVCVMLSGLINNCYQRLTGRRFDTRNDWEKNEIKTPRVQAIDMRKRYRTDRVFL